MGHGDCEHIMAANAQALMVNASGCFFSMHGRPRSAIAASYHITGTITSTRNACQSNRARHRANPIGRRIPEGNGADRNSRMRNALLSSVSHDLKTPLAAITGAASNLIESEVGTRRELVQTITEEADRLNHLIRDLLDMTRLEAGALQVRKEWHAVEGIVGATLARLDTRLRDYPATTHIPDDMPLIPLDSVLIDQVLVNLLENAIKYSPPDCPIDISADITDRDVLFQIADRGPGISAGDEERVFDKFYRARPNGGRVRSGLTVCRGIVEAHGGKIWAENRDGGGALVQFTLPLKGQPPEVITEEIERAE